MLDIKNYAGREQTYIKHVVLKAYLERLAYKVGMSGSCATFNYVDGFAGPWESKDASLADTSPRIAFEELRKARDGIARSGRKPPDIRCLFIEADAQAAGRLKDSVKSEVGITVDVRHGEFEVLQPEVVAFTTQGAKPFAFVFIDPTGWTGFGLRALSSLLNVERIEVLVNFMTKYITRFVDDPNGPVDTFVQLFDDAAYRDRWRALEGLDREDAIVATYLEKLAAAGRFRHVGAAAVLNPLQSRTHFHLVYGSRHPEGLRVFRSVESAAAGEQDAVRGAAQHRERVERTGQPDLFGAPTEPTPYVEEMRARYQGRAKEWLLRALTDAGGPVDYDPLEVGALRYQLTSPKDVHAWLVEWRKGRVVEFEGLKGKERTPKFGAGHKVVLLKK